MSTQTYRTTAVTRSSVPSAVLAGSLACITWGVFAFGAVYPWAYWPLAIGCVSCGLGGLFASRGTEGRSASLAFIASLAAVAAAAFVQLIPLPVALIGTISPATAALLPQFDSLYVAGLIEHRALSLVPANTWTALALYGSFVVLLLGASRVLSLTGVRRFAEGLAVLGVILALLAIVQKPLYAGKIYGFWEPVRSREAFGPFVNKNHFAGWMLLALPIVLALVCAAIERSMRGLKPGWRYRVLWLSSPEASRLVLLAAATAVMAASLVLTMSRSGISALAVSLVLTGVFIARGVQGHSRKAAGATYVLLLAITAVAWIGADTIITRFTKADWSEFNGRRGAWADALNVARTFPLTGTGLNTYGTVALFYQRHDLKKHVGEAHNDYLQIAAEGGLLVGIPLVTCVLILVRDVRRRMREDPGTTSWWVRRGAVTAIVAIALQESVDFSLQMPGNAALFAVICAIALHEPPPQQRPPERLLFSS